MADDRQPTQKFKGRLGNSFSQFGNAPTDEETSEEETRKTVKQQKGKMVKGQKGIADQEQEEGYPGRTFYIPDDLHIWLKMYATLRHTTMSKVVIAELEKLRKKYPLEPLLSDEE